FACGRISPTAEKLISVTKQSFFEGLKMARQGNRVSDISHAVQNYVEENGFSVVRTITSSLSSKLSPNPIKNIIKIKINVPILPITLPSAS
ncbi:MAG: M24 family metallopeptidase, partial [Campylobacter sp.]|nr:M24 family metallopeptidase [Campylobacter sp.]